MKPSILPLLAFVTLVMSVAQPQRAVIVSYPDNTPDNVIQQGMDAIKAAGGFITHEYKLIKAFAANAPAKALTTIQTLNIEYLAVVEEDQVISVGQPHSNGL